MATSVSTSSLVRTLKATVIRLACEQLDIPHREKVKSRQEEERKASTEHRLVDNIRLARRLNAVQQFDPSQSNVHKNGNCKKRNQQLVTKSNII